MSSAAALRVLEESSVVFDDAPKLTNGSGIQWKMWEMGRVHPASRYGHTLTTLNKKVYMFGGYSERYLGDLYVFQEDSALWLNITPGGVRPRPRRGHSAFAYNGKLYVFGGDAGFKCLNDLWEYNPTTSSWRLINTTGNIPRPRYGCSGAVLGNCFVIFGGADRYSEAEQISFGDTFILNLQTMEWTRFATATEEGPESRYGHTLCHVGGRLFMFGGMTEGQVLVNDVWEFVLLSGSSQRQSDVEEDESQRKVWEKVQLSGSVVPAPRTDHCCVPMDIYQSFFIFGGTSHGGPVADLWEFSIVSMEFTRWEFPGFSKNAYEQGQAIRYNQAPTEGLASIQENAIAPAGRHGAAIATFNKNSLIIFGGASSSSLLHDTWQAIVQPMSDLDACGQVEDESTVQTRMIKMALGAYRHILFAEMARMDDILSEELKARAASWDEIENKFSDLEHVVHKVKRDLASDKMDQAQRFSSLRDEVITTSAESRHIATTTQDNLALLEENVGEIAELITSTSEKLNSVDVNLNNRINEQIEVEVARYEELRSKDTQLEEQLSELAERVSEVTVRVEVRCNALSEDITALRETVEAKFTEIDEHLREIDSRLAEFETRFEQIDKLFEQVDRRFGEVDEKFSKVDERFEEVNKKFENVDERFEKVDERFNSVDERFEKVDGRFQDVEDRFEKVNDRFAQVDTRLEGFQDHFDQVEERLAKYDEHFINLDTHVTEIHNHLEQVDEHFERVTERFGKIDEKIAQMDKHIEDVSDEQKQLREHVDSIKEELQDLITKHNDDMKEMLNKYQETILNIIEARSQETADLIERVNSQAREEFKAMVDDTTESLQAVAQRVDQSEQRASRILEEVNGVRSDNLAHIDSLRGELSEVRSTTDGLSRDISLSQRSMEERMASINSEILKRKGEFDDLDPSDRTGIKIRERLIRLSGLTDDIEGDVTSNRTDISELRGSVYSLLEGKNKEEWNYEEIEKACNQTLENLENLKNRNEGSDVKLGRIVKQRSSLGDRFKDYISSEQPNALDAKKMLEEAEEAVRNAKKLEAEVKRTMKLLEQVVQARDNIRETESDLGKIKLIQDLIRHELESAGEKLDEVGTEATRAITAIEKSTKDATAEYENEKIDEFREEATQAIEEVLKKNDGLAKRKKIMDEKRAEYRKRLKELREKEDIAKEEGAVGDSDREEIEPVPEQSIPVMSPLSVRQEAELAAANDDLREEGESTNGRSEGQGALRSESELSDGPKSSSSSSSSSSDSSDSSSSSSSSSSNKDEEESKGNLPCIVEERKSPAQELLEDCMQLWKDAKELVNEIEELDSTRISVTDELNAASEALLEEHKTEVEAKRKEVEGANAQEESDAIENSSELEIPFGAIATPEGRKIQRALAELKDELAAVENDTIGFQCQCRRVLRSLKQEEAEAGDIDDLVGEERLRAETRARARAETIKEIEEMLETNNDINDSRGQLDSQRLHLKKRLNKLLKQSSVLGSEGLSESDAQTQADEYHNLADETKTALDDARRLQDAIQSMRITQGEKGQELIKKLEEVGDEDSVVDQLAALRGIDSDKLLSDSEITGSAALLDIGMIPVRGGASSKYDLSTSDLSALADEEEKHMVEQKNEIAELESQLRHEIQDDQEAAGIDSDLFEQLNKRITAVERHIEDNEITMRSMNTRLKNMQRMLEKTSAVSEKAFESATKFLTTMTGAPNTASRLSQSRSAQGAGYVTRTPGERSPRRLEEDDSLGLDE